MNWNRYHVSTDGFSLCKQKAKLRLERCWVFFLCKCFYYYLFYVKLNGGVNWKTNSSQGWIYNLAQRRPVYQQLTINLKKSATIGVLLPCTKTGKVLFFWTGNSNATTSYIAVILNSAWRLQAHLYLNISKLPTCTGPWLRAKNCEIPNGWL